VKLVHLVGFIIKKFVTMHCHTNVKKNKLLSSSLLRKNVKFKIYGTLILPVVWYGYEIWSLAFQEKRGLIMLENRLLRKIFGPTTVEVRGEKTAKLGASCSCTPHQILFGC
jgi:hypothetical protein